MKTREELRREVEEIENPLDRLLHIMSLLRAKDGCPWDRKQTLLTLKPYLIEEAYEVLDAIDEGDAEEHRQELGDLLLQVVFQSQLRKEEGAFDFFGVATAISDKLLRRHPHIFGDGNADTAEEVLTTWEEVKKSEGRKSLLSGIPKHLPGLQKAHRIGEKTARVGFDWPDLSGPREKISEELAELEEATTLKEQRHEVGDLLMAVVNYARHLGIDPEEAMQSANERFMQRFSYIEDKMVELERPMEGASLEELDRLWEEAKERLESDKNQ